MPDAAPLYPLFLSLAGRRCVVAGLGGVGRRKLAGLLACGPASVLVLDRAGPAPEAAGLLADARVAFARRALAEGDLEGCSLAFAATGDAAENRRIAALCAARGVWCNCVSEPGAGDFQVPAVARRAPLAAALSTGGASPALARRWKGDLARWLAPRARMAAFMARLRPQVLALGGSPGRNADLFRRVAASPLQAWLEQDDLDACGRWLLDNLPPALRGRIAELLHDLP